MKTKGIYVLYRLLQVLGLPFLVLYFLIRGLRNHAYFGSMWQRLGFLPLSFRQTAPGAIWLHAVSVGEVLAAVELVRRLRMEFAYAPVFVSASTLTGRATADEKLSGLAAGVFFAPIDYVFAVRRVLRTLRPSVLVVMETEIWPHLFREVKRSGGALAIVNGRISDRAAPRYFTLQWFFRHVLRFPDRILTQSDAMRERFLCAGAPPENVATAGNLKFDFQPRAAEPVWLDRVRPQQVWIAASTTAADVDEDDAVIRAFGEVAAGRGGLLLVLAPRKPERFDAVAQKLERAGVPFVRRSQAGDLRLPGVLLLDSIGELSSLFAPADVVFMGGSLASRGGHNILEPAFFARPIIVGPHMENFSEIAEEFRSAGAFVEIRESSELAAAVARVLDDRKWAESLGQRALACAQARRGATEKVLDEIRRLYLDSFPCFRPPWPASVLLWPWSKAWAWISHRRGYSSKRLNTPVISVGNLSMGGTGKTPFVLFLAEKLKAAGKKPGFLTRGYRRRSLEKHLILEAGARVPVAQSGDEAQILLRSGLGPVGIGADRFETGRRLEKCFEVNVLILDDGFQHRQLERQSDIVLIDALDPFGNCETFPLGKLREPMEALAHADLFVITRSEFGRALGSVERRLSKHNPRAPIFRCRTVPECWIEQVTGRRFGPQELPHSRVGAFCGLGNPESFWRTLRTLGLETMDSVEFDDHHIYRPREVRFLAEHFRRVGAAAVVTTEKDMLNMCDDCAELLSPLRLYWLKIRVQVDREAEFLSYLLPPE